MGDVPGLVVVVCGGHTLCSMVSAGPVVPERWVVATAVVPVASAVVPVAATTVAMSTAVVVSERWVSATAPADVVVQRCFPGPHHHRWWRLVGGGGRGDGGCDRNNWNRLFDDVRGLLEAAVAAAEEVHSRFFGIGNGTMEI